MKDDSVPFPIVVVVFLTCLVCGMVIGGAIQSNIGKREAVRAGVAHYESGEDGSSVFTYKVIKK